MSGIAPIDAPNPREPLHDARHRRASLEQDDLTALLAKLDAVESGEAALEEGAWQMAAEEDAARRAAEQARKQAEREAERQRQAARRTSPPRRFSSAAEALAAASSTPSMPPKFMTARDMEANLRAFMQAIDARVEALHATVAAAAGRLERDRVSKINRTLVRWFVVHTAKAVQGWKEAVARTRRLRGAAATLARVYRTWVALVLEGRSVRHQARRALGHWVNRLASLCFVAWADAAREAAEVRRALLGRAVGRMLHRLLAATFVPWCDHVVKMKASRALGRRVVARMQNALLAVTFDAWTDAVADARASRVERLRGAAGRLLHRTAALAFGGWRDGARAQVEERHATLAAVVQRMMNRLACFAFDEWVTWLARRTEVKRRAAYAIGPGRLQGLVWRTWRAAVVEARRERERQWVIDLIGESAPAGGGEPSEALAACLEGLAQLRTEVAVLKKALRASEGREAAARERSRRRLLWRWQNRCVVMTFEAWAAAHAAAVDERRQGWARALRRRTHECFVEWADGAAEASERQRRLRRAVAMFTSRLSLLVLGAWRRDVRETLASRRAILAKAAGRLMNRLLAMTFGPWCDHVAKMKASRALGRRVVQRMMNALLAATFDALAHAAAEAKERKDRGLAKAAARILHRTSALAFTGWAEAVAAARETPRRPRWGGDSDAQPPSRRHL